MIGTNLAHYQIVERIGAGGMGEVYRARDTKLNRDVAIKVLPEALAQDPDRMKRFEREARVLASLNHPNIASIYGLEDKALVLELVEGPTLAERLREGPLSIDEVVSIARQIADGLEAAHDKGVVHRDLKPANVKLTAGGDVKILDFGLAKAMDSDGSEDGTTENSHSPTMTRAATGAGMLLGTAAYMSPEQARGKAVDKRADVWAFGCLLYEMLTGKRLFEGETISDTLAAVLTREPDFARLPAYTPASVRHALARCLERDVKKRFRDIADVRIELLAPERETTAHAPGPSEPGARAKWLVAAVALAAAMIAFSLGYFLRRQPPESLPLRLKVEISPDTPIDAGFGARLALSPDGSRLAFVAGAREGRALYLRRLDQLSSVRLDGTRGAFQPFFSPDGRFVGFVADHRIQKVALDGSAPSTVVEIGTSNTRGMTWGDDDTIVFVDSMTSGLKRVAVAGGAVSELTVLEEGERTHRWPHFLPEDRGILFNVSNFMSFDDARIEVLELPEGRRKLVLERGMAPRYVSSGHLIFVRSGVLYAAPFDLDRLETTGPPVPLVEGIETDVRNGSAQFAVAEGREGTGVLAYLGGESPGLAGKLVWVDRDGRIEPLLEEEDNYVSPRFSPDGLRLVFALGPPGSEDLWVLDTTRRTSPPPAPTRLTFEQAGDQQPIWTPDGERIVFGGVRDGTPGLFVKRADGGGPVERLFSADNPAARPVPDSFSPDGSRLVFTQTGDVTLSDLWILRISFDGESAFEPEPLLGTPDMEWDAAVSPDGRWLSYRTGDGSIFVRGFQEGEGQWQVTRQGREARWARDGRELHYRDINSWWVAPVRDEGTTFELGSPQKVLEGRFGGRRESTWDVSPDGESIVILQQTVEIQRAQTHATLVFRWFEELERLAPTNGAR